MNGQPLVLLIAAGLAWASCIPGDQRRVAPADATSPDDGATDATTATDAADVGGDGVVEPDVGGECDLERPCPPPGAPCAIAECIRGYCVSRQRDGGSACDDHNACTGDGMCAGDTCVPGVAFEDGRACDDDTLYCNGAGQCQGGECIISIVGACPQLAAECVDRWECSEALLGACAPVPSEDGSPCRLGADTGWCSAGTCVPADMVAVPAGEFFMGCDAGALCQGDARPKHDIVVSAFAIDRTEQSERAWRTCLDGGGCARRANEDDPRPGDLELPVRWVDWSRAGALCASQGKRLCTEAEWEKAARGTDGTANFPWGNTPASCERAQYWDLGIGKGCGSGAPAAVGGRPTGVSPYGALDMAGNVAEWVEDGYDAEAYGRLDAGTPVDPVVGIPDGAAQVRVIRGGGWDSGVDGLRVYRREAQSATLADDGVGVRCCWTPTGVVGGAP